MVINDLNILDMSQISLPMSDILKAKGAYSIFTAFLVLDISL
jgi:hypothetical protein